MPNIAHGLASALEAISRNVPWSQHNPNDPAALDEFIRQLREEGDAQDQGDEQVNTEPVTEPVTEPAKPPATPPKGGKK